MGALTCNVRRLGLIEYATALERMRAFTLARAPDTEDEMWLLEHPPVYTVGIRARQRALQPLNGLTVALTDRGGDITYHGPGQPVIYLLLDLARRGLGIHELVRALEQAVIDMLTALGVAAARRAGAPGVYVADRKIASLGLRVRAGRSYHGLAFNAAMDLAPFSAIDPCGYPGLAVTHLAEYRRDISATDAGERLIGRVLGLLGYTEASSFTGKPAAFTRNVHARP